MTERKQFRDLAEPAELQAAIESLSLSPGTESVDLLEADGRVLAERIDAGIDVPGFDRSTMDGYAVRARDTFEASEGDPFEADLLDVVEAGEPPETPVEAGGVVSVATGAPMPSGAGRRSDGIGGTRRGWRGPDVPPRGGCDDWRPTGCPSDVTGLAPVKSVNSATLIPR